VVVSGLGARFLDDLKYCRYSVIIKRANDLMDAISSHSPNEMDFEMKNIFSTTALVVLLTAPLLVSAEDKAVFADEYLNVGDAVEQGALNISPFIVSKSAKPSDQNKWGSSWGDKVPFKGNVPYGVAAYSIDVTDYFPEF